MTSEYRERKSRILYPPDYLSAVAQGLIGGTSHINKFGSVVEVAADTDSDVWDGGGEYTFPDAGNEDMTHISQTTDQAAARGASLTIQGLDANHVEVEQTQTLNATDSTTAVALDTPLHRVNRVFITTDILLTSTVRVHNSAENVDYVDIQTDHNQTLNAVYTVPAGKSAYLTGVAADHVAAANKSPLSVHFHLYQRQYGQGRRVIYSFGIDKGGGGYSHNPIPYISFPEKTDIWMHVKPTGEPVHAHGSFDLILVDD